MGQYRQWLRHREIDQQLRSELATLEAQLEQLHNQIDRREQDISPIDNSIIRAFFTMQRTPIASQTKPDRTNTQSQYTPIHNPSVPTHTTQHTQVSDNLQQPSAGSVSHALFARSSLPNFDSQAATEELPPVPQPQQATDNLLPTNISVIVETSSLTDPQMNIPWWLRDTRNSSHASQPDTRPIDEQSARTNQLVERWFERWGHWHQSAQNNQEEL